MSYIQPIRTAATEYVTNGDMIVKVIEHFRQGDHRYRIVWNYGADGKTVAGHEVIDE